MDCTQDRSFLTKARLLATLFFISIFLFSSRSVHARAIEDIDAVPQAEDDQTTPEGPTSTKNFQLDTWKYQRKFDFSSSETQGPWKYGVPLTYDSSLFRGKNVYVHVIPWTHVDPGYKSSYTNSFNVHIGKILTSVVNALSAKPSRRFIWPETCILQRWYANANDAMKEALKKVIANGQLEIVTGGWVMADESLSHYETMLEELTEGHDWLIRALGVRPTVGFSVDAIGHSPVMSYILKKSGIKGTVINKIHYAYKKELAKNRALEFMWAPAWSNSQDDRLFTHVHPFANCDVAHSCGPDPEVCSMYDFTNIGKKTHWGKTVNAVTPKAIAGMAEALVDQYKQQAMLFRTNHIPVFLGGPSYYELLGDLGTQLDSYQSLFDYINKNPQYNVRIAFSNLSSWFSAVSRSKFYPKRKSDMPVVRGDFFNYADTRNDYWTGYYSTRTFFKKFSRGVGSMSKSINALFALLTAFGREPSDKADLPIILQRARRSVAVYQNHHGITGVSSKAAVREYVKGMHEARWRLKNTFLLLVQHALSREGFPTTPVGEDFEVSEKKKRFNEIVAPGIVSVPSAESEEVKSLVFYNNLPHTRIEYVTIRTNTDAVEVRNADGEVVLAQVCPAYDVIQDKLAFVAGIYSVTFPVRVPALGLTTMFIGYGAPTNTNAVQRCEIITSNSILGSSTPQGAKSLRVAGPSDPMCMENGVLTVCADKKTGRLRTADKATFEEDYVRYSTWTAKDGQVLMSVTDLGKAVPEGEQNVAHALFRGIYTDEHAYQVGARLRVARLAKEGVRGIDALGLRYLDVSIKDQFREDALSLRIKTNVRGRKDYKLKFVTDINGFAYAERVFRKDMPPSANFFPITTSLRVQDQEQRVAFLVAQPMGATCYKTSDDVAVATCEFIVDRKTHSDDGKGLADKVEDGVPTLAEFRISFEEPDSAEVLDSPTASELSHALGTRLNNHIEYGVGASRKASAWKKGFGVEVAPLASDLPLDVEIPNLQVATSVLGAGEIGITLARHIVGRHVAQRSQKDEVCISLTDLFKCAQVVDVTEHTLTYLHEFDETENTAVMDGTVCLQKGTIHSYTFNVRIDQDCRVPSMASPRPSKWSLPGDNEDDAANANKKAYDGMFDDAEFDGTPPGIPTQQAKKIGNRKNKQKHQIGQNPIEENDNDNDEDDNNEENVKNKKTNVQLGDDIFEEDEWDTGENNNNDNDNDNKDHFEDDNENTDEEKTGHNKAYNNINTIKHNNNDNDDDGEIGINTKTKHTENKRNIYKEQNNEEEEENNMNIDDDQQQQRQQQQKLNHNTNNDEDDNNDDEKEGNDYLTNNDNNKKDNDQPNNMYPTVVEVDQQTEINKKQNAEAATTSYDTKSSTKIQVGIVTVSMSFIISFFLFVKRIISAKIFGIILITTALINTIIFIF